MKSYVYMWIEICMKDEYDLNKLHEKVDILGVELLGEVADGLMDVFCQGVRLLSPDVVSLPPDPLDVVAGTSRRSSHGGPRWQLLSPAQPTTQELRRKEKGMYGSFAQILT